MLAIFTLALTLVGAGFALGYFRGRSVGIERGRAQTWHRVRHQERG